MSKAEEYIRKNTNQFSNEDGFDYVPWLTPDQARRAVEIAREETLKEIKSKLLYMLNTSIDNKHFFEQLDDYIDDLKQATKDE